MNIQQSRDQEVVTSGLLGWNCGVLNFLEVTEKTVLFLKISKKPIDGTTELEC